MENNYNSPARDTNLNRSLVQTNIVVNYVPQFATEAGLAISFAPTGFRVIRDFKNGYSYGFEFVKYFNEEDAAKAIDVLNGITYTKTMC